MWIHKLLCALMSLLYNQIIEYNYYFTLRDRIKSSDIQREFRVKPLLLRIERSQLKWFGRPIRILRLPLEVFRARPTDRRPGVEPEHAGEIIYISSGLERSDVHSSKCIKWLKTQKIFFFFYDLDLIFIVLLNCWLLYNLTVCPSDQVSCCITIRIRFI